MVRRGVRAALLALVVVLSIAACTGQPDSPESTPSASDSAGPGGEGSLGERPVNRTPGVSVIADRGTLLLPDGTSHSLTSIQGGVTGGFQTADGWLVQGYGDSALWLVHPDGRLQSIVDKADGPVAVAPDGRHIAWRWDDTLYTGRVNPGATPGVTVDVTSPAPERGHPVSLTPSTVVLGYSETGGGIDHWDMWYPDRGDYVPSWDATTHVRVVFGPTADGTGFYGLVDSPSGSGTRCLAQLDPDDDLNPVRTACGFYIALDRASDLSPDGARLAMRTTDASDDPAIGVVDLATVFTAPGFSLVWSGPPPGMFAWEDASTLLAAPTDGGLMRFRLAASTGEAVSRPGLTETTTVTALLPRRYDPAA